MRRILYTRHDGGVTVCTPSMTCIRFLMTGGRWERMPRGFIDEQVETQASLGIDRDVARRFSRGLAFGGLAYGEAFRLIGDRDCRPHGTALEIVTDDDLPDQWFRNAWRRGHNGGPVCIELEAARGIQWQHIIAGIGRQREAIASDWRRAGETITPDMGALAQQVARARDVDELRAVGAQWHGKH